MRIFLYCLLLILCFFGIVGVLFNSISERGPHLTKEQNHYLQDCFRANITAQNGTCPSINYPNKKCAKFDVEFSSDESPKMYGRFSSLRYPILFQLRLGTNELRINDPGTYFSNVNPSEGSFAQPVGEMERKQLCHGHDGNVDLYGAIFGGIPLNNGICVTPVPSSQDIHGFIGIDPTSSVGFVNQVSQNFDNVEQIIGFYLDEGFFTDSGTLTVGGFADKIPFDRLFHFHSDHPFNILMQNVAISESNGYAHAQIPATKIHLTLDNYMAEGNPDDINELFKNYSNYQRVKNLLIEFKVNPSTSIKFKLEELENQLRGFLNIGIVRTYFKSNPNLKRGEFNFGQKFFTIFTYYYDPKSRMIGLGRRTN